MTAYLSKITIVKINKIRYNEKGSVLSEYADRAK